MKIVLAVLLSLFPALVVADLHKFGLCYDKKSGNGKTVQVFNEKATQSACVAYLKRNTGNKQWDKCPDCTLITENSIKYCRSAQNHIGGDELYYYCRQNGASDSMAWT